MTSLYEQRDGIAIVALNNPPVNGLSVSLRRYIVEAIEHALSDPGIRGIILIGAGRSFSAGADIREFGTPAMSAAPTLSTVLEVVEGSTKPIVAAIQMLALGGGLELAMSAHYRVVAKDAHVGLPEVKLGLLPGAGGTQRLPRAVGLETALNMIVSGASVKAESLAETKLFDRQVEGDLLSGALEFAQDIASHSEHPKVSSWPVEHHNAEAFLAFARTTVAAQSKNLPAPLRCVDTLEAAVKRPFPEGSMIEQAAFAELLTTVQSKALRHAFFAERNAAKAVDGTAEITLRPVESVAIVGAGTMGGGIAMSFLNAGIPVTLLDASSEALERGVATVRKNYETSAQKGKIPALEVEVRMALLRPTLSYEDLRRCDLIVEAVFEDYAVKRAVFEKLDEVSKPGAILATNTSTLDVNRIAQFTRRPENVVGLHFFSPANIMRLLEVIRGDRTAPDVLRTVMSLSAKVGKVAVVSGVCDGFIGNRMVEQYIRQALYLLEEGALPQQVDRAMEAFGMAMGPFRMSDLAGNDIGWAIRKRRYLEQPQLPYSKVADTLCERGRFGQKTMAGWYDYKPGDRAAHPSRLVDELVNEHSRKLGIARRYIEDSEIVERLIYALVNEGAKILEEGIAARASDIDVVYLNGYGFPAWRGGPMFYADTVGLYNVVRAMKRYANGRAANDWEPAALLARLAETGRIFSE